MKKTDLAYIAGIIDGEGCILIRRVRKKGQVDHLQACVQMSMCEEHIPQWLRFSFGGSVFVEKRRLPEHRPLYKWAVTGRAAVSFLQAILPYLIIKRPQAEVALRVEGLKPGYRKHSTPMDKFLQELEAKNLINPRGGKPVEEE